MDPVNRRAVWKLIRDMKQNRIVILTTVRLTHCLIALHLNFLP